jgi:predicted transcriptional regulator
MNLAEEKRDLIRQIQDTEDAETIQTMKEILASRNASFSIEDMPDEVKASFERGLAQSERGEGVPHEVAFAKYRKWLKK